MRQMLEMVSLLGCVKYIWFKFLYGILRTNVLYDTRDMASGMPTEIIPQRKWFKLD